MHFVPGPEYIDFVMNWVDKEISDGVLFPRNACKCAHCVDLLNILYLLVISSLFDFFFSLAYFLGSHAIPEELSAMRASDLHPLVPHLRDRVLPPLPAAGGVGRRVAPQHLLQALHLLHMGVRSGCGKRAGGAGGHY